MFQFGYGKWYAFGAEILTADYPRPTRAQLLLLAQYSDLVIMPYIWNGEERQIWDSLSEKRSGTMDSAPRMHYQILQAVCRCVFFVEGISRGWINALFWSRAAI